MESVSHSRPPNKGSHATVAKGAGNGGNYAGKTMYDDVFGGPPRFGFPTLSPRPEDYSEIFGGFHAYTTSIPVLDLPTVDEEEVFFDARSFDYGEVFGGFDALDFASSYEELLRQSDGSGGGRDRHGDVNGDSSEEAWTPADTESLSGDSDHSGKNKFLSTGDPYEQIDSSMEFSISYHKLNRKSNGDLSNGITRIARPRAPEYTCIFDEIMPVKKTEKKNPPGHVHDDVKGKHLRKTISLPAKRTADQQSFTNNLELNGSYEKVGPLSDEMFVTISEVNLKTQPSEVPPPSRPPPILDSKRKGYGNSQTIASGGTSGNSSPPYFDVEIDASSAAAVSAAAMKAAMEKAQTKLKSAKELMERKREGVQSSMKPGSKHDEKDKKEKLSKVVDGSRNIKDEMVQGTGKIEDSGMKPSVRQEKQEVMKTMRAASNPLEKEGAFNMAKMPADDKDEKESLSSQPSDKIDVADEWQEARPFFELVGTDNSKMAFVEARNYSVLVEKTKGNENQVKAEKAAMGLKRQEDRQCKENTIREDHELEKVLKNLKTAKETCERGVNTARSEAGKGAHRHKGHEKKVKVVIKQEENEMKSRMLRPLENGKATGLEESLKSEKQVNGHENGIKFEVQHAVKHKENKQLKKETSKSLANQKRSKECQETKDGEKRQSEVFVSDENDIKLEQAHEQAENEKTMERAHLQEEKEEKSLKQTCELEEYEKKEKGTDGLDKGEMIWRKALEQLENEKRLKQALEREETQKERETCRKEENEKRPEQVLEQENNEKKLKMVYEREAIENRLEQDHHEKEKAEKPLEETFELDNIRTLKEAWGGKDEMKRKHALELGEYEELMGVNEEHLQTEKDKIGEKVKIDEGAHQHIEGEDLMVYDEACKLYSLAKPGLARTPDKNCDEQEEAQRSVLVEDSGRMQAEYRDCEKRSEATEGENLDRRFGISGVSQDEFEHAASQLRMEDVAGLYDQDDNVKNAEEAGIGVGLRNAEKSRSVLRTDSDNEKQGRKPAYEWRERGKNTNETKAASDQEEEKDKFVSTPVVKESAETGRKIEAAQSSIQEVKGDTLRTARPVKISQSTERKEKNVKGSLTPKEIENETKKREIELEKERLRKIEEEREREREREKDRMAVDKVTLEARERAYAEACERAERAALERATTEARQRAMAEACERLEKASAEAREKSSTEARLIAERAAVERATAEAREHAVEKAMAERAVFEARERVERSVSDKFPTFSRNSGMRTCSSSSDLQNQQFQSTGSFNGSRYSSDYNGVEGESVQRCKARLERYQRTAERAAKALAEKNMRDLLAQREQAEINRLAETLDADVKRWSSGKKGNLRALLSTLQYILGPDSGWQPIPLTEVITSAAVKKVYRKATLCLHPDKLQQRGANIQQKYICEKVYDLLKEAWNKFNSE